MRRLIPWVAALSLLLNLYFLGDYIRREMYANQFLWGNSVYHLILGVTYLESGRDPEGLVALTEIDAFHSLPRYAQRVDHADLMKIERYLREVAQVQTQVMQEFRETGSLREETARERDRVAQGLGVILEELHRVNELKKPAHAWNHGAWRSMWRDIARGLAER